MELIADTRNIYPHIARVDVRDYENGALIYNPAGNEKLLKKISDDLVSLFVLIKEKSEPEIISKDLLKTLNLTPEQIVNYANQNIVKLFNERSQILKKEINNYSTLYTMVLNGKTESSLMISYDIWNTIKEQLGDYIFVSVPKQNEINYCSIKGNSLTDLFAKTIQSYKEAGNQKLSPSIYLLHNSKWVMFDKGMEQIFEYCSQNKLIEGFDGLI